jgi:hypothetical protein
MTMPERYLLLPCPACHDPVALQCCVEGSPGYFAVSLVAQACDCDPYDAWDDVWEAAREVVYEEGLVD